MGLLRNSCASDDLPAVDTRRSALLYVFPEGESEAIGQYYIPFDLDYNTHSEGMYCGCCHLEISKSFGSYGASAHCQENCSYIKMPTKNELEANKQVLEGVSTVFVFKPGEHLSE